MANEPQNLVFTTGAFCEIIAPLPRQFELRLVVTPAVPVKSYTVKTNGIPIYAVDGKNILPADQPLEIEISAFPNTPFKTNVTFAAYEEGEWKIALQKQPISPLGDSREWQNSLGMKFVAVPGTQVLFSIWENEADRKSQQTINCVRIPRDAVVATEYVDLPDGKRSLPWCER